MDNTGNANKCPFRATLMTRSFSCQYATEVTRRDGPDIGCNSEKINQQCLSCFDVLKNKALPELGFEDDLTVMPASALQKIQYGGLLAMLQLIEGENSTGDKIDNIAGLISDVFEKYGSADNIPVDKCVNTIKQYKIKRRRGK